MSESSARAERRDLRRAMGPHVQAFASDTKQAIQILQAAIQTLQTEHDADRKKAGRDTEYLAYGNDAMRQRVDALEAIAHDHARALTEVRTDFYDRSLTRRLRWLLFGR